MMGVLRRYSSSVLFDFFELNKDNDTFRKLFWFTTVELRFTREDAAQ